MSLFLNVATISYCSPISELQPAVFGFHHNHGTSIALSNNQRTAERTGPEDRDGDGIVISHDPMQVNHLFEVSFQRKEGN